ncbi:MAG: hypothetical protein WA982_04370 [Rubrobacteraceae bacterium]
MRLLTQTRVLGLDGLRWLRERLNAAGRASQRLLVLGDGGFCVAKLFHELPGDIDLMARCARNRALYALPNNEKGRRRDRKRKYGEKARKPHEWLAERSGWRRTEFMVRSRAVRPRYRIEGLFVLERAPDRPVVLVVVKGVDHGSSRRHRKRRDPSFFLVTVIQNEERWTLPFAAAKLLAWMWQR